MLHLAPLCFYVSMLYALSFTSFQATTLLIGAHLSKPVLVKHTIECCCLHQRGEEWGSGDVDEDCFAVQFCTVNMVMNFGVPQKASQRRFCSMVRVSFLQQFCTTQTKLYNRYCKRTRSRQFSVKSASPPCFVLSFPYLLTALHTSHNKK
jgi:hypothetical protein